MRLSTLVPVLIEQELSAAYMRDCQMQRNKIEGKDQEKMGADLPDLSGRSKLWFYCSYNKYLGVEELLSERIKNP